MRSLCLVLLLCSAACAQGVLSEERVIKLPNDQAKWHVSVVGEGEQYQEILGWFEIGKLRDLKNQVHFHPVTPQSSVYSRYEGTMGGMPTVRVQDDRGVVLYEAAGNAIPMTGEGLYGAIANAVSVQEVLPWRRRHANPQPTPEPDPKPPVLPPFSPPDDGGAPKLEAEPVIWPWILLLLVVSTVVSQVRQLQVFKQGRK